MATSFADPAGGVLAPQQQQDSGGDQVREVQVNLGADVSAYTQQMSAAQAQTEALSASVGKLGDKLGSLSKTAGHIMIGTGAAAGIGLTASMADAAAYEHQLGTLRATASITGASMDQLKKGINDAFTSFPIARSEVVQLTETIANLGVTGPRAISAMTSTFIKLGGATGEAPTALAQGTVQLARQSGNVTPDAVAGYSNALLTVSKNQGVAATGVLDFASSIAPMARQAGIGTAAIEGISGAFAKAGADGAYAANTFNQIVSDITQLSKSGSPELAKYSNFVGQTLQQFKQMSGTQQITSIFQELSKGGGAANNFVTSLGLGTRAVSSVQAVVQSGSLPQAIAQAQGAAQGTGALDTASTAAFSGLTNSVTMLGAQFTQLGEIIGAPLLTPITELTKGLTAVVGGVDKILEPLGKLPAVLGVVFSTIATVAGVALTHAGAIGAYALGRVVIGRGSAPRVGYRAGQEAGRAVFAQTMTEQEARDASEIGRRAQIQPGMPEYLPARMRVPYEAGFEAGKRGPGLIERTFGMPLGGAVRAGMANVGRGGLNLLGYSMEEQTRILQDSGLSGLDRSFYTGAQTKLGWRDSHSLRRFVRSGVDFTAANLQAAGGLSADAAERIMAARGVVDPATGERVGGLPLSLRAPLAGGFRVGQALGALGKVGAAAFSLPGALALSVGLPLASGLISRAEKKMNEPFDVEGTYNHITKFNQLLDTTSTNLARLGETAGATGDKLSKFASTPLEQVAKITRQDVSAVTGGNYKVTDQTIVDIAKQGTNTVAAMTDYLKGLVISQGTPLTGDLLTALKRDVVSGYGTGGQGTAQTVIDSLVASNKAGTLRSSFNAADIGNVANNINSSDYKSLIGGAVSTIISGTQDTGPEGVKSRIGNLINLGATSLKGNQLSPNWQGNYSNFTQQMATAFGGQASDYDFYSEQAAQPSANFGKNLFGTTAQTKQTLATNFVMSTEGKVALAGLGINVDERDKKSVATAANKVVGIANATVGLPPPVTAEEFTQLKTGGGALGRQEAATGSFVAAVNAPENAAAQFDEAQRLANEAMREANGNFTDAAAILRTTASAVGGASSATGQLNQAAAAWIETLQGFHTATLSRADQLGTAYHAATAASDLVAKEQLHGGTAQPEDVKAQKDTGTALGNEQENYRQYMIGRIQQIKSFNKDWDRNQRDYNLSVANSFRDFATQSTRSLDAYNLAKGRSEEAYQNQQKDAAKDYYDQRLYAQQDYQTASQRSADAYALQVQRANEDHATQLARQAEQSAQTIYDPYQRQQLKATTDAGTLAFNLHEQNADIKKQLAEVKELKRKGLSQQAIDTLDLTNPENAQQVDALSGTMTPALQRQINAEVAQRARATTALTQTPLNRQFREGEQDFNKQMTRARHDFDVQQGYMLADYDRSLSRMADSFDKTEKRAARDHKINLGQMQQDYKIQEAQAKQDWLTTLHDMALAHQTYQKDAVKDLTDSMTEYTGSFSQIYTQLMKSVTGEISTYAPQWTQKMITELDKIAEKYPGLFSWTPGSPPPPTGAPGGPPAPGGPSAGAPPGNVGSGDSTGGDRPSGPNNPPTANVHNQPSDPIVHPPPHLPPDHHAPPSTQRTHDTSPIVHPPPARNAGGRRAYAEGGISLTPQQAMVSETGPELHLPLNARGQDFMAGLIAKSLAQGITMAFSGASQSSVSTSNDNSISFSGAEIKVVAPDPNKMARELAAKAKLRRLTSPARH